MDKLGKYFEGFGFTGDNLHEILDAFTLKTFEKNEQLVSYGKTSRYIGFVDSGMFQYYVTKDGEEKTTYINIENTWLASLLSFVSETPSLEKYKGAYHKQHLSHQQSKPQKAGCRSAGL